MSGSEDLLIGLIVGFSFCAAYVLGFGAGPLAIPLLSLFIDLKDAVTLVLLYQAITGIVGIGSDWREGRWDVARPILIGAVVGIPIGTYALVNFSNDWLKPAIGALVIVYLVQIYCFPKASSIRCANNTQYVAAGAFFGAVQGFTSAGGPVLSMILGGAAINHLAFRASMMAILLACNLPRVGLSSVTGLIDGDVVRLVALTVPFLGAGILLGRMLKDRVSAHNYRGSVNLLMMLAALGLIGA